MVFSDELNHASIIDGCRLSRAEVFVYDHCDVEHLEWGIEQAEGRGALIVTDSVFSMDGDVAPLAEIVELAAQHRVRVMVDEAHATGALGPGGRGAVAEAGLEDEVDVIVGTLGKALGSYGAFVACDRHDGPLPGQCRTDVHLLDGAAAAGGRRRAGCARAAPGAAAAASASSPPTPQRCARSSAHEGFDVERLSHADRPARRRRRRSWRCRSARRRSTRGVFAQAIRPPTVPPRTSRLRLAVMASHREEELRTAARILGQAARSAGYEPQARPAASAAAVAQSSAESTGARRTETDRRATPTEDAPPPPRAGVFDFEAPEKRAA